MAACKMPQRPTKAEEMEKFSEAALAFVKEGLNLEENNQETSVRILSRIQFVNPYFIEKLLHFRPYYITKKAYICLMVPLP